MSWAGAVYRAAGRAATGSGLARWVLRDRPQERAQRLGDVPEMDGAIWLHAASVGELAAAGALARALREGSIGPVVLSVMTRTGLDAAADLPLDRAPFHPPLDAPGPVARALSRLRPAAWIALETELWPTLLRALDARGVPTAIASARLSERGQVRMRRARSLYRPVLRGLDAVAARTAANAARYLDLGARPECVRVTGDLKEDHPAAERTPLPRTPRWIAACTRPGEEEDVLAALARLEQRVPVGELLLAPRHPQRFDEVTALAERTGRPVRRWSRTSPGDLPGATEPNGAPEAVGWSILVVDTMGVLDRAYRASTCAFVGGSLRPFRGHSPLEAARAGRAVAMGPHTANCAETFARLEAAGGAVRVDDPESLACRIAEWLAEPHAADAAGRAAHAAATTGVGSGRRTIEFLRERGVLR